MLQGADLALVLGYFIGNYRDELNAKKFRVAECKEDFVFLETANIAVTLHFSFALARR